MEVTPGSWFGWANNVALAGWLILLVLPKRHGLVFWIPQYVIPFGLGLLYAALMLVNFFVTEGGYGSSSASSMRRSIVATTESSVVPSERRAVLTHCSSKPG